MRIAYIVLSQGISINDKGGAGTHIRGTIKGFEDNDVRVKTFIHGDADKSITITAGSNDTTTSIGIKSFIPSGVRKVLRDFRIIINERKYLKKIYDEVLEFNPDIIYERSCYLASATPLSKKIGVPHYIETSGVLSEIMNEDFGGIPLNITNLLERIKYLRADVVVTEAKSAISFVKEKFKLGNIRVIAKPLGVIPTDVPLIELSLKENLKRKYGITSKLVIGFIGTFGSYQKVELLLPVFKKFKGNKEVCFLLIGNGGNFDDIKEFVDNNNITNVVFTGRLAKAEVMKVAQLFDIGIVPDSVEHMYPIKTIEYGVLGVCPLVPNYYAFKSIISDNMGVFFEPNSSESIIHEIDKIAISNDFVCKGQEWKKHVDSNFTWDKVVEGVLGEAKV